MIAHVAWKNLSRERTRLAISVGGVAFAVLLILLVRGLYNGFSAQTTQWIRSVGGDVWVAQSGSPGDFFHSVSLLPVATEQRLRAVEGVADVVPLVMRSVVFDLRGTSRDFRLVGVDPRRPIAKPPGMERGDAVPGPGEIVVDRVFARNADVALGDRLAIGGSDFRVVGIARGGNTIISQYAWASLPDVTRVLGMDDIVNYVVVRGGPGVDARALAARIRDEVPGTKPMVEADFIERNLADLEEGFLPIVLVLVVVAFVIGTAVIGLTIYTATLEKRREYGVLKAVGVSNRRLFGMVYLQALAAAAFGLVLGIGLTYAVSALVTELVPSFVTTFESGDFALVVLGTLGMSVVSSFIPMRPVARLDPAEVFRV